MKKQELCLVNLNQIKTMKMIQKMKNRHKVYLVIKLVRIARCRMLYRSKIVVVKLLKMAKVTQKMKIQAACTWKMTNHLMEKG